MVINYQDQNLIVMYLQIYLAEYCGLTVHKVIPYDKKKPTYYEITSNDPLVVTGYYDIPTYTSLALFMAYNYPNEGYPQIWRKDNLLGWVSEDYIYQGDQEELLGIIADNMERVTEYDAITRVPERVLSYIFNEVVTPNSSPEEILRIKQMVYDFIYAGSDYPNPLSYNEELFETIINIQRDVINKYTIGYTDISKEIIMDYEKDIHGDDILDHPIIINVTDGISGEVNDKTAEVTIDKQVNKVTAISTSKITTYNQTSDKVVIATIKSNKVKEATVIYNVGGAQEIETTTTCIDLGNNKWQLNFVNSISDIEQLTATYVDEEFVYNPITGNITFFEFSGGKKIEITENVNSDISFPPQFENYKITGYVDPWTEIILKEGYEDGDS